MLAGMIAVAPAGTSGVETKNSAVAPNGALWHNLQVPNKPDPTHRVKAFHVKSEVPPTIFSPVQSKNAKDLGAGKVLVASRNLIDPNFAETVVLLVHYDAEGVVGLVLNRRTHIPLSRVLEGLKAAKDRSDPVYLGGPVETPAVFALLKFGGVYLISTKALFEQTISARPDPNLFHVYLGYAGWNNDQLRKEVDLGAWFIFQADAGIVFNSDPDSLWPQMIRKTELKLARSKSGDPDQWALFCRRTPHQRCAQFNDEASEEQFLPVEAHIR
jgi:putative transcriptional regulator